jgi:hypothetical protein
MKKCSCILALVFLNVFLLLAQENIDDYQDIIDDHIVYNGFRALNDNEVFVVEQWDIKGKDNYWFIISIQDDAKTEKILELKALYSVNLFKNKKSILVRLINVYRPEKLNRMGGSPLYYIDGVEGTIEYIGLGTGSVGLIEEKNIT